MAARSPQAEPGRPDGRVPGLDLKSEYAALKPEIDAAVAAVLASGRYIGGPEVEGIEREFAQYCGTRDAVAVGSGTDALRFALIATAHGAEERDPDPASREVITSPFSFIATTEAITQAGARPVFVDIEPETYALDPSRVEAALTPRTQAILPVHLYGHAAQMGPIVELARSRNIAVIEDACQAHGAMLGNAKSGALGDAGCFSFYPTKNLGACGEGGMVTTSRAEIARRVRRLRDHGQTEKYRHVEEGYNGRLDALQAAILRVKLRHLDQRNERRRTIAARYRAALSGTAVRLPVEQPGFRHVYHLFVIRVERRDAVREALAQHGIDSGVHYPVPLHRQPCYARMGHAEGAFPEAEKAAREILTLPLFPEMSDAQVDRVCDALRSALETR